MPPSRFVRLTPEEHARLREIEQNPYLKPKARLRAQVLRLSARGEGVGGIAAYAGRSETSVLRDLDRWEKRGFEGLADGTAPGRVPRISGEVREFMKQRLSEDRTWNASRLAEALAERFGIFASGESIRQHLLSMGFRWKRTRYAPAKEPVAEEERRAREELEELKRGLRRERSR
jgi:transposase